MGECFETIAAEVRTTSPPKREAKCLFFAPLIRTFAGTFALQDDKSRSASRCF